MKNQLFEYHIDFHHHKSPKHMNSQQKKQELKRVREVITEVVDNALHEGAILDEQPYNRAISMIDLIFIIDSIQYYSIDEVRVTKDDLLRPEVIIKINDKAHLVITGFGIRDVHPVYVNRLLNFDTYSWFDFKIMMHSITAKL